MKIFDTFQEAKKAKNSMESIFLIEDGEQFEVFVLPENEEDRLEQINDFRGFPAFHTMDDEISLDYSRNGKFILLALWCDGAIMVYKHIDE